MAFVLDAALLIFPGTWFLRTAFLGLADFVAHRSLPECRGPFLFFLLVCLIECALVPAHQLLPLLMCSDFLLTSSFHSSRALAPAHQLLPLLMCSEFLLTSSFRSSCAQSSCSPAPSTPHGLRVPAHQLLPLLMCSEFLLTSSFHTSWCPFWCCSNFLLLCCLSSHLFHPSLLSHHFFLSFFTLFLPSTASVFFLLSFHGDSFICLCHCLLFQAPWPQVLTAILEVSISAVLTSAEGGAVPGGWPQCNHSCLEPFRASKESPAQFFDPDLYTQLAFYLRVNEYCVPKRPPVAIKHVSCVSSILGGAVSMKHTLDFEVLVWKKRK